MLILMRAIEWYRDPYTISELMTIPQHGYTVYTTQLLTGAHTGFLKMDDPQTSGFA